jgi:hypothetical protein
MKAFYACLLVACGSPQALTNVPHRIYIGKVAPELLEAFTALREGLNEGMGYEAIILRANGGTVVYDPGCVQVKALSGKADAIGQYDPIGGRVIVCDWSAELIKTALAHELLHAFGLKHSEDTEIMRPHVNYACVGREISCMVDALTNFTGEN